MVTSPCDPSKSAECSFHTDEAGKSALTVVAVGPGVRRHGAVAREVLPLLDAHAHVGAGVLLAGRARAWREAGGGDRGATGEEQQSSNVTSNIWALTMQDSCRRSAL